MWGEVEECWIKRGGGVIKREQGIGEVVKRPADTIRVRAAKIHFDSDSG